MTDTSVMQDRIGQLCGQFKLPTMGAQSVARFTLDSTICETYGLAKEGARDHGYTGKRGYHPLLAVAAGTGDVLMARLREGRANTARGAAHFLRETVGRVRYAGARGQLTVRADSGFYTHAIVAACRRMDVRFSITIRQSASLRSLIEAIPEQDWTPIPYWMEGAADVAETSYTPFQSKPDAAPVRLIVRRVKPTPGSQLALFATYSYHGFITDREGETLELEADHRRHAEIENAICPASTIFAGWRQSVLPVHLLGLDALLGSVGPVAGDVKLQDDGVVHDPVNRRGGGHGVGKDALPLGEDQV